MNRFQGPYSGGSGQKVPPIKNRGSMSSPMGSPKNLRFPFRFNSLARLGQAMWKRAPSPYIRLMNIDPARTNRASRRADTYLTQFMPEWYHQSGLYNYAGWKEVWNASPGYGYSEPIPARPAYCPGYHKITSCNGLDGVIGRQVNLCDFTTFDIEPIPVLGPNPTGALGFSTWIGVFPGVGYYMQSIWGRNQDPEPYYGPYYPPFPQWPATEYTVVSPIAPDEFEDADPLGLPYPVPLMDPLGPVGRLGPARGYTRLAPYSDVATNYELAKGGGFTRTPGVHHNVPPGSGKKEKKFDLYGNGAYRALANAMGKFSEGREAMDDIAKAIPHNPCKGLSPGKKAACILANSDKIYWNEAVKNLLVDQLQDRVIGTLSGGATRNFKGAGLLIGGRGYGVSRFASMNSPK